MNRFGVCYYDFEAYEPKIENLVEFSTYDEAYYDYLHKITEDTVGYPDRTLWIVWIEDNRIIQFEQLVNNTKCRIVDLEAL